MNECKPLQQDLLPVRGLPQRPQPAARLARPGMPVPIDPIKPELKPPGTKRLKLKCDALLSTSAFKFKLRRYTLETLVLILQYVARKQFAVGPGRYCSPRHRMPFDPGNDGLKWAG